MTKIVLGRGMGASLNGVFVPIKSHLISDLRKLAQQWGERVGSARDYRRPKFHRGVTWRRKNRRCTHTRGSARKTEDPPPTRKTSHAFPRTRQPPRAFGVTFRITPCFVLASILRLPRDRIVSTALFRGELCLCIERVSPSPLRLYEFLFCE